MEGRHRYKYCSSRGLRDVGFADAVLSGWAADGGMLLPQEFPMLSEEDLEQMRGLAYPSLACEILKHFVDPAEIPHDELASIITSALASFAIPEILELHELGPGSGVYVCDLWNGPSLAFKDLGMCVLCAILDYLLTKKRMHMKVLVGTSGDTGPSALQGIKDRSNMSLIVLYPLGRVSAAQELQMLSSEQNSSNLRVVGVEGTSDDLDRPIENILKQYSHTDTLDFSPPFILGSVNSVNVMRVLVQIVHIFWCYFRLSSARTCDPLPPTTISFSIPTGAAGHVTAAVWAKTMGLPVNKLIVANNQNDVITVLLEENTLRRLDTVEQTHAPAMDIQVPYNIERLFFMASNGNTPLVTELMSSLHNGEAANVPPTIAEFFRRMGMCARTVSNEEILSAMSHTNTMGRLQDPHSSVGVSAALWAYRTGRSSLPIVCMGCAHPIKFLPAVQQALQGAARTTASVSPVLDQVVVDALPSLESNIHVRSLMQLLLKQQTEPASPRIVFSNGSDWTAQLLELILSI